MRELLQTERRTKGRSYDPLFGIEEAVAVTAFKVTSFGMTFDSTEHRRQSVESIDILIAVNVEHQSERTQRVDGGNPFEAMMGDDCGQTAAI